MKRILFVVSFIVCSISLIAESPITIAAVTRSGARIPMASVSSEITSLRIGPATQEMSLEDPIVDIEGLKDLPELDTLTIILLPHLLSYDFLATVPRLKSLTISHGKIESLVFLSRVPALEHLRIEMCRSGSGTGIVSEEGIDFGKDSALESVILLDCGISRLPALIHVPEGLTYLDMSWNEMRITSADVRILEEYRSIGSVVFEGIEIDEAVRRAFPNVSTAGTK